MQEIRRNAKKDSKTRKEKRNGGKRREGEICNKTKIKTEGVRENVEERIDHNEHDAAASKIVRHREERE